MDNIIDINNFSFSYGTVQLFNQFNFQLKKGQCAGVFGPTGAGKTTLLNKIAKESLQNYKVSYVFQDNKLLENQTVLKNIELPLENIYSKADARGKAEEIINLFELTGKENILSGLLSGGEKQRVNLCRAIAYPCDILLLDEPFSAQDETHRLKIISDCKKIIKDKNLTSVVVSHNRDDLIQLCDFIVDL